MSEPVPARDNWGAAVHDYVDRHPLIGRVFDLAQERQTPIYLVGGTVRDLLLDAETRDLDFAVQGDGLALARYLADRLGGAYVTLDRDRGTGRVVLPLQGSPSFRSVSFRLDVAALRGADLEADLRDRDFTINAMAVLRGPRGRWQLFDPLGGQVDLAQRILRAPLSTAFAHDPVRTLRAVRMEVQFGCAIQAQTLAWLRAAVPLLSRVSAERLRDEWFKILGQSQAADALRALHRLRLLRALIPQAEALDRLDGSGTEGNSALESAFRAVAALEELLPALQTGHTPPPFFIPDALHALAPDIQERYASPICDERSHGELLKCAVLLRDIGRSTAPSADADHARSGARIAASLGRAWRCSNEEITLLRVAVEAQPLLGPLVNCPPLTRRAVYRVFQRTGAYGVDAAFVSMAWCLATPECAPPSTRWARHAEMVSQLLTLYYRHRESAIDPPSLLSGHDLMDAFGLPPGRRLGELLARLREAQAAGEVHTRPQALACVARWIKTGRGKGEGQDADL